MNFEFTKKTVLSLSMILVFFCSYTQEKVDDLTKYYTKTFNECSKTSAYYYISYHALKGSFIYHKNSLTSFPDSWYEETFKMDGTPVSSGNFTNGYYDGLWKRYYDNGKLYKTIQYRAGTELKSTIYYENGNLKYKDSKWFYETGELQKEKKAHNNSYVIEISYYKSGEIEEKEYFKENKSIADTSFYESGSVRKIITYKENKSTSDYTIFKVDGDLDETRETRNDSSFIKKYGLNNQLINESIIYEGRTVFFKDYRDEPINEEVKIYSIVEEMPRYENCKNVKLEEVQSCTNQEVFTFVMRNVIYPAYAVENDITGKEYIRFVINEEGEVTNVESERGTNSVLTEQAIRVVSALPKFTPGYQRGKAAKVSFVIPVNFQMR